MIAATAVAIGGPAITASAATPGPAVTAAPAVIPCAGWTAPLGAFHNGTATYWLSYDSCDHDVRGAAYGGGAYPEWHLWVYNVDTKAEQDLVFDSRVPAEDNYYTNAISDNGTQSHVCIQPYNLDGSAAGSKTCTAPDF